MIAVRNERQILLPVKEKLAADRRVMKSATERGWRHSPG